MNRAILLLSLLVLLLGSSGLAQSGKTLQECQQNLGQCRHDLADLQQWADTNYPIGRQLASENEELRREVKTSEVVTVFAVFAGIGFGVFMGWAAIKSIRCWWPLSKTRRVLITLLLMAAWVTVAAVVGLSDSRLVFHPLNLVLSVFVYSLPALTFGSVAVWWFGRTKPEILW